MFYVAAPPKAFVGTAVLASDSFELSAEQVKKRSHGKHFYCPEYGIQLTDTDLWDKPKSLSSLVHQLSFIENKEHWGTYFQGGIRGISEQDFRAILEGSTSEGRKAFGGADIESEAEFALETHLEQFIDENWNNIDFGAKLERYKTKEQDGRQFSAGPWSIDLCKDIDSGDFVVIELKRGKTSDTVVGQTLRYIKWVRENLASPSQNVRGLIIAKEVDQSLQYSLRATKDVSVLTYKVSFGLKPFSA